MDICCRNTHFRTQTNILANENAHKHSQSVVDQFSAFFGLIIPVKCSRLA